MLTRSRYSSYQFSACHYHIRDLRHIRHTLDFTTATTIATDVVHSRLDYCNSLYHGLSITQINRLQHSKCTCTCRYPHYQTFIHLPSTQVPSLAQSWQLIQYKTISITHNLLHITEPKYIHRLINIKPPSRTRSSDHLCLSLPSVSTRLKFADRSFRNYSPRLWNSLPTNLRSFAPDTHHSTTVISSTSSHPCKSLSLSLSPVICFFRALKLTSSLFPTLHNVSALPSFPAPFPTGQF